MNHRKSLIITGQTGTGKTSIALELATKFEGELISADSRQIYLDLNIGTGKYDNAEDLKYVNGQWYLKNIPIWGVNILPSGSIWSAGEFAHYARGKINNILQKSKLPIIVGGTGFYIKSLINPDQTISVPLNQDLRKELFELERSLGTRSEKLITILQKRLKDLDPNKLESMNNSDVNNSRRLMRAIEVGIYKKTTVLPQPSEFFNFNAHIIGLHAPKEVLQSRITSRVEEMFKQGYADEVKILIQKYGWDTPALQAIGYKEWQPFLANSITFEQLKISIIQAHLQYARKQMIYLKRIPEVIWIDVSNSDWKQKVIEYCLNRQ